MNHQTFGNLLIMFDGFRSTYSSLDFKSFAARFRSSDASSRAQTAGVAGVAGGSYAGKSHEGLRAMLRTYLMDVAREIKILEPTGDVSSCFPFAGLAISDPLLVQVRSLSFTNWSSCGGFYAYKTGSTSTSPRRPRAPSPHLRAPGPHHLLAQNLAMASNPSKRS